MPLYAFAMSDKHNLVLYLDIDLVETSKSRRVINKLSFKKIANINQTIFEHAKI